MNNVCESSLFQCAQPNTEGTYYLDESDGLKHCAVCGEPVEVVTSKWGKRFIACRCVLDKAAAEKAELAAGNALIVERERKRESCIPMRFRSADIGNLEPDSYQRRACERYVETFKQRLEDGRSLLLYGPVGTGKTHAACAVGNAVLKAGYRVFFAAAGDLPKIRGWDEEEAFWQSVSGADLLIFDDFGATRTTATGLEKTFNAIDGRYRARLPTLITTNLSPADMRKAENGDMQRIFDRVLECCVPVNFGGASRRVPLGAVAQKEKAAARGANG